MDFDKKQQEAIQLCTDMSKRIVAVTGEAGTGKTTIIREVYARLLKYISENWRSFNNKVEAYQFIPEDYIVLVAPTGKAAKRIYEATGIPAMTLHRLLEYPSPGELDEKTGKPLVSTTPKRCRSYPINQKIVLCDEYAMVNYELHRNLIDALPRGGVIRMFGDCNQLEPIEESEYLKNKPSQFQEILTKFSSVTLDKIHRQDDGSTIIENSHKINKGIMPLRASDFCLYFTTEQKYPTDYIINLIDNDEEFYGITKQIITPSKNSWVGTTKLNSMIQTRRFSHKIEEGYPIERHKWSKMQDFNLYVGDKVIFTKNNYDLGVFNGESGIVTKIQLYGTVTIDFGDKIVDIPTSQMISIYGKTVEYNPQKDIDLAYVITTHKAQGSEYKEVAYIMDRSLIYMCNRKNLYTAVTRAREKVNIITDQKTFVFALKNIKNPYTMREK
ncbi:MAG: AAA family ATPase [Bacilli bacterium]|nr:AAA family ATPase [Bacilli bacterium]